MRFAPLLFLLAGCHLPDRYHVTTGMGDGDLESLKAPGDRDFDSQWMEVGVSGPLGVRPEPSHDCRTHPPIPAPAAPTAQPRGGIPWLELFLLLAGAGGLKASEYGYKKARSKRAS